MDLRDKKVALIRQLLKKAESTNEHEAAVIQEAVAKLIVEYSIDQSELLDPSISESQQDRIIEIQIDLGGGSYFIERLQIASCVVEAMGLTTSFSRSDFYGKYGGAIVIVGFTNEANLVASLVKSVDFQAVFHLKAWWNEMKPLHSFKTQYQKLLLKRGYLHGYADGVWQRLSVSRKESTESVSTSKALLLLSKKSLAENWVSQNYKLGEARKLRNADKESWLDGYVDGFESDNEMSQPSWGTKSWAGAHE